MAVAKGEGTAPIAFVRWFVGDQVGVVLPMYVLREDDEVVELFIPAESATRRLVMADGSVIPRDTPYAERHAMPRALGDAHWHTNDMLLLYRPGDEHSVWLLWNAETGAFQHWYLNLQDQMTRTAFGWDTSDHVLDIVVHPDRSWAWKDEHELADAVAVGRYTPEEASAIRALGERLVREMVEPWAWPLNAGYEQRRPCHQPIASVPDGWDTDLDADGFLIAGEDA